MSAKSDAEVFMPKVVKIKIAGRDFEQKPLSLRGTSKLVTLLAQVMRTALANPAVAVLMETDINKDNWAQALPVIIQVLSNIPDAMENVVSLMLGFDPADEQNEDTVEFIGENATFVTAMKVLRTFIEQNEPEEMMANFFALREMLDRAMMQPSKTDGTA